MCEHKKIIYFHDFLLMLMLMATKEKNKNKNTHKLAINYKNKKNK